MATGAKKLMKMPRQPKKGASLQAKVSYLDRLAKVKKENALRKAYNKKLMDLDRKIAKAVAGFSK
ncbi:hypothetical protein J6A32_10340 [Methanocorpusculum sp.]|nr:hypothetical protein [Methanocorpusculum sp.]